MDSVVVAADPGTASAPGTGSDAGSGGGRGGGNGPGTGPGSGPGSGLGNGGGSGFLREPSPKQLILPEEHAPRDLRGRTIRITFWIKADGNVERVEFTPEINNREYADKFRDRLLHYVFTPARSASGEAIAVQYPMEFTF